MARLEREPDPSGPLVDGFADGGFRVEGVAYRALLLTPVEARSWDPPAPATLAAADLEPLLAIHPPPEFVILGTGARLVQPPRAVVRALEARGIGVEAMDSRAAARAWGLLRGEGRWIAAALFPLL